MRNLKKVLALVLAMAMSLSLAVSAGAAFNDQDKIVNEEAVDMCVALNIINGRTNGDFDPAGNVTRAEAAKMICIALNGGKEPVLSASATPAFADIAGHWAAKYIEYCVSEGIVAGKSATSFDPNGSVTGTELAKMLLIAVGYNAEHAKFIGANWDTNVNVVASQKNLYEGLETIDPAVALSRDNAAQMIWNALNANLVEYEYTLVSTNGTLTSQVVVKDVRPAETLLANKYGVIDDEAAIMTGFTYDEDDAEWTYTFDRAGTLSYTSIVSDVDYTDLFQQNVKVIYTEKAAGGIDTLYGMFAYDSSVIAEGVFGDIDWTNYAADLADGIVTISDVEYDITGTSLKKAEFNGAVAGLTSVSANAHAYTIKAIDNTGDDKIDVIVYVPFTVESVDYVGASTITTSSTGNVKVEDINLVDTVAEDDYVMVVKAANTADGVAVYTKLEVLSGEVSATKAGDVQVDGTWYTPIASMTLGNEYDFVAVNGYVFVADATSTTVDADDYAVVVKYQSGADWNAEYPQAVLLFANGESKTVAYEMETAGAAIPNEGALVKVVEVEDDVYTLTTSVGVIDETTQLAAGADAYVKEDGEIGGYAINDDAVIFVQDTSDTPYEYKVITGADLKKLDDIAAGAVWNAMIQKNESTGYSSVVFAYVSTGMTTSDDTAYGYVVSDATATKDGNKTLYTFTIWNGTAEVELTTDGTNVTSAPAKGAVISYKLTDGKVSALNASVATADAIVAYDGKNINFDTATENFLITEDTVIIYIDAEDVVGVEGGAIKLAHDNSDTSTPDFVDNAMFVKGDADGSKFEIDLLVIDVDGHIDGTTVLK